MELAFLTVEKIVGLFLIVLIGVITFRMKILDSVSTKHLSNFLLNIVTPCLMFMSFQIDFDTESLIGLGITAALGAFSFLLIIALCTAIIPKKDNPDMAIERVSMVFSNAGFIGIPVVNAVVGREGVFYLTAFITMYHIFFWTYAYSLISADGKAGNMIEALKNIIQPSTVAIALGLIFFITRIRLPSLLAEPIGMVGDLNTPLAMVVAGCNLADSNIFEALKKPRMYYMCFIKLILIPALMILIFRFIPAPMIMRQTVVLAIACPSGAMGTMLAVQFDRNSAYSSLIFTLTTLFSLVTIPCMVFFMSLVM